MRRTFRLLASVKPARYLEAGTPTGLTGLVTNASPRASLLFLYSSTLDKLKAVPESSVYRQSVEALTKHRLAIVEGVKPAGYDEWLVKAQETLEKHPEHFQETALKTADGSLASGLQRDGKLFVLRQRNPDTDIRDQEWDGEAIDSPEVEGSYVTATERAYLESSERDVDEGKGVEWVDEPKLTAAQVEELENKIGAGLIEEVIQVAEGELGLIDTITHAKAWESLEEKPADGQWSYFERKE